MTDDVAGSDVTERDPEEALARFFAAEQAENGDRADLALSDAFRGGASPRTSPALSERLMRTRWCGPRRPLQQRCPSAPWLPASSLRPWA